MLALIAAAAQPMVPSDIQTVTTLDGWTLPLRHYAGAGRPVLLVHGLGVNHYNFDWRPDVSLAWWLQVRGWDVWVTTLRGDDGTVPPDPKTRSWTFEDHARKDLPAVVDTILARTGAAQLDWVGHSMGGMLLYAALSEIPEKIGSGWRSARRHVSGRSPGSSAPDAACASSWRGPGDSRSGRSGRPCAHSSGGTRWCRSSRTPRTWPPTWRRA